MSEFISGIVICPFYKGIRTNNPMVVCEGIRDGTLIHLTFRNKDELIEYVKENCCDSYKQCKIADIIFSKYEE